MPLTVSTWNINSVRLRIDQVRRFLESAGPDVLCLQETKCPDDRFPLKELQSFGYPIRRPCGPEGLQRRRDPVAISVRGDRAISRCAAAPTRAISPSRSGRRRMGAAGIAMHNFYVPAGGDIPTRLNEKFAHKLQFLQELRDWGGRRKASAAPAILSATSTSRPWSTTSGATSSSSTWSAIRRSRPRRSRRSARRRAGPTPCATCGRSRRRSTPGGATARPTGRRPTRAAGSTTSGFRGTSPAAAVDRRVPRDARLGAALGPRAGDRGAGALKRVDQCGS